MITYYVKTTPTNLNLRTSPNTTSLVLRSLPQGTELGVLSPIETKPEVGQPVWLEVSLDDFNKGYVRADFLIFSRDVDSTISLAEHQRMLTELETRLTAEWLGTTNAIRFKATDSLESIKQSLEDLLTLVYPNAS